MMKKNWIRAIGAGVVVALWLTITGFAWFGPAKEISEAERRPLTQMPDINAETLLDGSFMGKFEKFTLDQFPLRDSFRQLKSLFHYYAMRYRDNNDIYAHGDHIAKLEYPLNPDSVGLAATRFQLVYDRYLKDSNAKIYLAVVPDKSYYMAEENGYLSMDYEAFFQLAESKMPWATPIDLTDTLELEDYYRTDTHWRQEKLLDTAKKICDAMGTEVPKAEDFTQVALEKPFYGVYYGQAALPLQPETMYIMQSDLLDSCTTSLGVLDSKTGELSYQKLYNSVYDMEKAEGRDMYETYLSGAQSLLRIENPNATTDKELIIFRDSFGSSISPLLVQGYETVTIVDIRYISSSMLGRFMTFDNQDVLFLYSTSVLNSTGSALLP